DLARLHARRAWRPRDGREGDVPLRRAVRVSPCPSRRREGEGDMTTRLLVATVVTSVLASIAGAAGPDAEVIARVTGLQPEVKNAVAKVSVPRSDLAVTVDGIKMQPFQGFTSWAAFAKSGKETVVMGDLTLTEDE